MQPKPPEVAAAALAFTEALLREVQHAVRDPFIERGTRIIYRGLQRQKQRFIRTALPKLKAAASLQESTSDADAIRMTLDLLELLSAVTAAGEYDDLLEEAALAGANQAVDFMGLSFATAPQRVKDFIASQSLDKIGAGIDATTADQLRAILVDAFQTPTTYAEIVKEIKAAGAFSRSRAEMIAVTEIGNAFSEGTLIAAQALASHGIAMQKSWLSEADACDICAPNMDSGWIGIDEEFPSGDDRPLGHPNCRCALMTRAARTSAQ